MSNLSFILYHCNVLSCICFFFKLLSFLKYPTCDCGGGELVYSWLTWRLMLVSEEYKLWQENILNALGEALGIVANGIFF